MPTRSQNPHAQLDGRALRVFAANERMNQLLIEHLDPAAWKAILPATFPATLPAKLLGRTTAAPRTIAAIFTHMHNVRTKWIRLNASHLEVPAQLNRARATPHQTRAALAESAERCAELLAQSLDGKGRVQQFLRDGWAQPWLAGVEMLCYMLAHEAHHRGQVCMLAHQLGFPLPIKVTSGIWNWEKLWRECGFSRGPGLDT